MAARKQIHKSAEPFGGAKVIYSARIEKESVQDTQALAGLNYLERPETQAGHDAIEYYTDTIDYNAFHARCLRMKADISVGLGMNLIKAPDAFENRLSVVNEYGESFTDVISRVALDLETTGNGYLEIVVGAGRKVEEFYFMPSARVYRRPRGSETAWYYLDNNSGHLRPLQNYAFGAKEAGSYVLAFQIKSQNSRNYGLPDWRGALPDIELDYYSVLYNQKFFINSGIPDLAIIVEGGQFDKNTQDTVVNFMQSNIKGLQNAHRTLYLPVSEPDVKIRFEKLGLDVPKDASFDNMRSRCRDNIISAHGIYPRLVGVVTSGQLGGGGEAAGQLKTFQEIFINPRQSMWQTKLTPVLSEMGFGAIEFSFEKMDTSIQESASQYYPSMIGCGVLTVEKAREELGYEIEMVGDDRVKAEKERAAAAPQTDEEKILDTLNKIEKAL